MKENHKRARQLLALGVYLTIVWWWFPWGFPALSPSPVVQSHGYFQQLHHGWEQLVSVSMGIINLIMPCLSALLRVCSSFKVIVLFFVFPSALHVNGYKVFPSEIAAKLWRAIWERLHASSPLNLPPNGAQWLEERLETVLLPQLRPIQQRLFIHHFDQLAPEEKGFYFRAVAVMLCSDQVCNFVFGSFSSWFRFQFSLFTSAWMLLFTSRLRRLAFCLIFCVTVFIILVSCRVFWFGRSVVFVFSPLFCC